MSERRRIWVVSELYYPEQNATGRVMTAIAEAMADAYDVSVLCAQPTYDSRGIRAPRRETHQGVDIERVWGTTLDKNVLPFRLLNAATTSLSMYLTARRQFRKGDVVLVVTNPPTMPSLILRACRQRGAKCILLVHDVYPDVLLRTGTAGPSSRTVRSLDKSTRALLAGVDRVIVIGRDMKHLLESKQVPLRHPIEFIPNWADLDEVRPIPREDVPLLHELGIADRFVIQYAGNMGRTHDLETAIEAAAQLGIQSGVHFSFIGGGAKKAWLQAEVSRRENLPVSVHDFFPLARLNESLNACEVALISFLPGMGGISVPSRMYNVMAAGKPILAVTDEDSELAMVIREEQIGWVIPPGDSNALVDAINEAKSNSGKLRDMSFRARRTAEKKYALAHVIGHYQGLFRELFSED